MGCKGSQVRILSSRPTRSPQRKLRVLFARTRGELVLPSGGANKTVPTESGRGFLGNEEGCKITVGNLGRPDEKGLQANLKAYKIQCLRAFLLFSMSICCDKYQYSRNQSRDRSDIGNLDWSYKNGEATGQRWAALPLRGHFVLINQRVGNNTFHPGTGQGS